MSWLKPAPEDKQDIQQLSEERPELYAYSQVLALALRVDSLLLRNLRVYFLPNSSVELETEFWFSTLVHTRNVQTAVIHSGIARIVCETLKDENSERYKSAKSKIMRLTQHWPETERIEQEMRWAVLEGDEEILNKNVQRILKTITLAEGDFEKKELARWVKGTLPMLKETAQVDTEQQWLSQYVAASLGMSGLWWSGNDVKLKTLPEALIKALPETKKQKVGLRLRPGVLEILKPEDGLKTIEITIPLPTIARLSILSENVIEAIEPFWIGRLIRIPIAMQSMELQLLDGSLFKLSYDKPIKVFISYSHDSDDHKQSVLELSDRLRDDGIDCYIDQYIGGAPRVGWQRWIEQQVEAADFVLVVCTELYLKRFKGKDRLGGMGVSFEGTLISQVLYEKFQQSTKFYPLIPDQGSIDNVPLILRYGSIYKFDEEYESIYRILTDQPRAIAKPLVKNKHSVAPLLGLKPFNVPYESKGEGAIGIDEILKTVHQTITNSKKTTIGQGVSIQGIGGLGKTQLAVEYAHRYRDQYEGGVVWLTVDQNIDTQLVDLAEKTKWVGTNVDAKAKIDIAKDRYSKLSNTLLVYDNVDHYDEIKSLFPQSSNFILLTSRNEIQQGFKSVSLNTLDEKNSLKLLSHESRRHIEENELATAKELVEKFDGLPLALEMAGAYVGHSEISWNDYLALFDAKGLSFLEKADIRGLTNHESNIRNTLSLSDELLGRVDNIENIINLLAWGANEAIDQTLMANMLNESEIELIEPIAIANKLKIIKKEEDGYVLYRLVRAVWKEQRPLDLVFAEKIAKRLAVYMKSIQDDFLQLSKIDRAARQALEWVEKIENVDIKAQLLGSSSFPDYYMGRYKSGLGYIEYALTFLDLKSDSLTLSDIYAYKGSLNQSLGDYEVARLNFHQALDMKLRLYPEQDHPEIASCLSNIGSALQSLANNKDAKSYFQQALEMRRRLYSEQDHSDVSNSLNDMGGLFQSLGNDKAAKTYYQQALEMRFRLYPGQDHPYVSNSLNNMGFTLKSLGDTKAAESYYKQSLEMRRRLYPEQNHPDIAESLSNVGLLLMESKKCLEAQALLSEALRMYQHLEIEPIQQETMKEGLRKVKKNIKMQKRPGSKKGRYCKDC